MYFSTLAASSCSHTCRRALGGRGSGTCGVQLPERVRGSAQCLGKNCLYLSSLCTAALVSGMFPMNQLLQITKTDGEKTAIIHTSTKHQPKNDIIGSLLFLMSFHGFLFCGSQKVDMWRTQYLLHIHIFLYFYIPSPLNPVMITIFCHFGAWQIPGPIYTRQIYLCVVCGGRSVHMTLDYRCLYSVTGQESPEKIWKPAGCHSAWSPTAGPVLLVLVNKNPSIICIWALAHPVLSQNPDNISYKLIVV